MLKILVTYAVQGEFVELKWPDIEPYYVRTGIGKVKSAILRVENEKVLCHNIQLFSRFLTLNTHYPISFFQVLL